MSITAYRAWQQHHDQHGVLTIDPAAYISHPEMRAAADAVMYLAGTHPNDTKCVTITADNATVVTYVRKRDGRIKVDWLAGKAITKTRTVSLLHPDVTA